MVLSNAERQKRHRQRLQEIARDGVTPEMIVEAARLLLDHIREAEGPQTRIPDWDEWLAAARTKRGRGNWLEMLPDFTEADNDDGWIDANFGAKADLIRKVSAVVRAVKYPPVP
jgi:hypothetical protein